MNACPRSTQEGVDVAISLDQWGSLGVLLGYTRGECGTNTSDSSLEEPGCKTPQANDQPLSLPLPGSRHQSKGKTKNLLLMGYLLNK